MRVILNQVEIGWLVNEGLRRRDLGPKGPVVLRELRDREGCDPEVVAEVEVSDLGPVRPEEPAENKDQSRETWYGLDGVPVLLPQGHVTKMRRTAARALCAADDASRMVLDLRGDKPDCQQWSGLCSVLGQVRRHLDEIEVERRTAAKYREG